MLSEDTKLRLFSGWICFLCILNLGAAGVIFSLKFMLSHDELVNLVTYILTFVFGYAIVRMGLQMITHRLLSEWSIIFPSMPPGLQDDCAFMVVDGTTFLWWAPLLTTMSYFILSADNLQEDVADRFGPLIYIGSAIYATDRVLHLSNCMRLDRYIHHSMTWLIMLASLEWGRSTGMSDFGYLLLATCLEIYEGKIKYTWFLSVRYARRHARQGWPVPVVGVDRLFVPSKPTTMARIGQVVKCYFVAAQALAPFVLILTYLVRFWDQIETGWKILHPFVFCAFQIIDRHAWVEVFRLDRLEYWQGLVVAKSEKDIATTTNDSRA